MLSSLMAIASVDTSEIESLLAKLHSGADLVIGCRENERLDDDAMGFHQRFGNKLATYLIRKIWRQRGQ